MNRFDKEVKKISKNFQVPDTYHEKIDKLLDTIQEDNAVPPKRKSFVKAVVILVTCCLIITGYMCFSNAEVVEAGFLEIFKQTIMDFLGMSEDDSQKMGIKSEKEESVSKPDLMIELQETLMDSQNIFIVVKITAPPEIEFNEEMTFDYFGFCEGSNYNSSALVPGARDCTVLEVLERKKNVATFVVSISTDRQIEEGKEVTAFFQDLIAGPYEKSPEVLVEGIWSLSFTSSYTDSEEITAACTDDMKYSLLDWTATIEEVRLLPLGMTLVSDVSSVPIDILHTSDTRFTVRLKMIDGSEILVTSPNAEDIMLSGGGSVAEYEEDGKTLHKYVCQFDRAIDTGQVLGVYMEDCYVPLKEYE